MRKGYHSPTEVKPLSQAPATAQPLVNRAFLLKVSFIAGLSGILYGFDIGIIATALLYVKESFPLSKGMEGFLVGVVPIGTLLGAILGGILSDRFGRRLVLILSGGIFIAGSILSAVPPNVETLIVARLLLGIAIGFTSVTAPVYVSELAPPQTRGSLIGLYQLTLTGGIVLAYGIGYLCASHHAWRTMFGLGTLPAVLFFVMVFTVPESPRWLVAHHREAEAEKVLHSYTDEAGTQTLLHDIRTGLATVSESASWRAVFSPVFLRGVLISGGFVALQQLCGVNSILYYGPRIFILAGLKSDTNSIGAQMLIGVVNMIATLLAVFLVDRLGRKPLLYFGVGGMTASLLFLSYTFAHQGAVTHSTGVTAVVCLAFYIACSAASMGAIAWILVSEVFPLRLRSSGAAAGTVCYGLSNFLVSWAFPSVIDRAGNAATFGIFAGFCVVTLFFARFIIPETAGRELESISAQTS
jgi:sugar porter (SP) family MFS transporter